MAQEYTKEKEPDDLFEEAKPYFIKFQSIQSSRKISRRLKAHSEGKWRKEEKIHGSNFSCIGWKTDDGEYKVTFAKRTSVIPKENSYFDFSHIKEQLTECTINFMIFTNATQVNIYGELYGGNIQKEIKYQKEITFSVFGVKVDNAWLPFDNYGVLNEAGFTTVPLMAYGTLIELINHDNDFTSGISTNDEKAEGFVLKFIDDEGVMHMIKNKATLFVERHTGMKIAQQNRDIKFKEYKLEDIGELDEYKTSARLSCVLSKYGPVTIETKLSEITKLFIKDIIKDYAEDHPDEKKKDIGNRAFAYFKYFDDFVDEEIEIEE
jgi:Rnl2 family RNA ligase